MYMGSQATIKRIALLFVFLGVSTIVICSLIIAFSPEQIKQLINKIPGITVRNPFNVAITIKKTPKILFKIAIFLLGYGGIGFWLSRLHPGKMSRFVLREDDFQLPPLYYVIGTALVSFVLGYILVSQRMTGSLWCDEATHAECALNGSWLHPWIAGLVYNMRPYSYLMRAIVSLFGFSEFLIRLPSVISYCLYGWFLSIVVWTPKNRLLSSIAGLCILCYFMVSFGSIYTAAQARGHMPAAVMVGVGLWFFIRATRNLNPKRHLIIALICLSLAVSMVMTSSAAFAAIWLSLIIAFRIHRPLLSLENTAWFFNATTIAFGCIFLVYAPMLPKFLLWMATNPQWQAFGINSIIPWTNGLVGLGVILLLLVVFLTSFREDSSLFMIILTVIIIYLLLFVQHHAKFIYAAGAGTSMALLAALILRSTSARKTMKSIAISAVCLMIISTAYSFHDWMVRLVNFVPESMARQQVQSVSNNDSVLFIGHCTAPRFYLFRKGVKNYVFANNFQSFEKLLKIRNYDFIILNGSCAGPPKQFAMSGAIPSTKYKLIFKPLERSEQIWVWKKR